QRAHARQRRAHRDRGAQVVLRIGVDHGRRRRGDETLNAPRARYLAGARGSQPTMSLLALASAAEPIRPLTRTVVWFTSAASASRNCAGDKSVRARNSSRARRKSFFTRQRSSGTLGARPCCCAKSTVL